MKFKLTIFLLVANITLFFSIWLLERNKVRDNVQQASIKPFTVLEISGKNIDKPRILKREKNRWQIVSPMEWKANAYAINGIQTRLNFLNSQTSFSKKDALDRGHTLAEYGLDEPLFVIKFGDGENMQTIKIGKKSAVGDRFYVLDESNDKIIVVDKPLVDRLIGDVEDLRDQSIFSMGRVEVNSFSVRSPIAGFFAKEKSNMTSSGKSDFKRVGLVRGSTGWKFETPIEANADNIEVDALLSDICQIVANSFVNNTVEKTGFESNPLTSEIMLQGTNSSEVLKLGALSKDGKSVYARLGGNSTIFTIDSSILKRLDNMQNALRDKIILRTKPSLITGIDISENGKVLKLRKLKDNQWDVIATSKNGEVQTFEANLGIINKLLLRLENVKARQFVNDAAGNNLSNYGINDNCLKVSIISNNKEVSTISMGEIYRRNGVNMRYASVDNGTSVYGISLALTEVCYPNLLDYRSSLACSLKSDDTITSLKITDVNTGTVLLDLASKNGNFTEALAKFSKRKATAVKNVENFVKNTVAEHYSAKVFDLQKGVEVNKNSYKKWNYKLQVQYLPKDSDKLKSRTWYFTERTSASIQYCAVDCLDTLIIPKESLINAFFELTQDSFEPEQLKISQPVAPKQAK